MGVGSKNLAESPIIDTSNGITLQPLFQPHITPKQFQDKTGYEAFINHIHLSYYVEQGEQKEGLLNLLIQAVLYSYRIKERLGDRSETFRIDLSLEHDSEEITVRFFALRPNEPYISDDLDDYKLEDVIVWDIDEKQEGAHPCKE